MHLGLSLSLNQVLNQTQRLTQFVNLKMELSQLLIQETFKPDGVCPRCDKKLTAAEILMGFNRNPADFTTGCPVCKTRFRPSLVHYFGNTLDQMRLSFLCEVQALDLLKKLTHLKPEQIKKVDASLYYSLLFHFGGIKAACRKIGINYRFEKTIKGWRKKIVPFLGQLPDSLLAGYVHVTPAAIGNFRKSLDIPKFKKGTDQE